MKPLPPSQLLGPQKGLTIHLLRKRLRRAVRREPGATTEGLVRLDPSQPPQMWRVANPQHPTIGMIAEEAQRRNLTGKPRRLDNKTIATPEDVVNALVAAAVGNNDNHYKKGPQTP